MTHIRIDNELIVRMEDIIYFVVELWLMYPHLVRSWWLMIRDISYIHKRNNVVFVAIVSMDVEFLRKTGLKEPNL